MSLASPDPQNSYLPNIDTDALGSASFLVNTTNYNLVTATQPTSFVTDTTTQSAFPLYTSALSSSSNIEALSRVIQNQQQEIVLMRTDLGCLQLEISNLKKINDQLCQVIDKIFCEKSEIAPDLILKQSRSSIKPKRQNKLKRVPVDDVMDEIGIGGRVLVHD